MQPVGRGIWEVVHRPGCSMRPCLAKPRFPRSPGSGMTCGGLPKKTLKGTNAQLQNPTPIIIDPLLQKQKDELVKVLFSYPIV